MTGVVALPVKFKGAVKIAPSVTIRYRTPCGTGFFIFTYDAETYQLLSVECKLGKNGHCVSAMMGVSTSSISRALSLGAEPEDIIRDLVGVSCGKVAFDPDGHHHVYSCHDALGHALVEAQRIMDEMILEASFNTAESA